MGLKSACLAGRRLQLYNAASPSWAAGSIKLTNYTAAGQTDRGVHR